MTVQIEPIEIAGQFWVCVVMDGHKRRYGPYADISGAEAAANHLIGVCAVLGQIAKHPQAAGKGKRSWATS